MNKIKNSNVRDKNANEPNEYNEGNNYHDNQENLKLEFILSKYNYILSEYQVKYGNELFLHLDRQLTSDVLESAQNDTAQFKKILVDNFSLVKEYEKELLDKTRSCEFMNVELNRLQMEMERIVEENKQLREDLENTKEERNKMYKTVFSKSSNFELERSNVTNMNADLNTNFELVRSQNEHLLSVLEKTKYESDSLKQLLEDYKEKLGKLSTDYGSLESDFVKVSREREDLLKLREYVEEKMKENNLKMILNEKKTNELESKNNKLENENKFLKSELKHYKEIYEELETRKNNEVEVLMRNLEESSQYSVTVKERNSELEDIVSELKFENNKLKQETVVMKYDLEHLTKILEDTNFAVKSANEKEKHIDNLIKSYKKKIDEANLEKEKAFVRLKLLEKQNTKIGEEFSKQISEKQQQFEGFIDSAQEKFTNIIDSKEEQISLMKNEILSLKIEKDKYFNEYIITKKENDKFSLIFRQENEKYINKYEESEKASTRTQHILQDKINNLVKKLEKIEHEKKTFEEELNMLKTTEKNRESLIDKMSHNEETLMSDVYKYREKSEALEKEKELNKKEIERMTNLYETKMSHLKEQYDFKLAVLESALKNQKQDYTESEDKAYEMLKKQENVIKIKISSLMTIKYFILNIFFKHILIFN
jgi:chromosome segregation ATPase